MVGALVNSGVISGGAGPTPVLLIRGLREDTMRWNIAVVAAAYLAGFGTVGPAYSGAAVEWINGSEIVLRGPGNAGGVATAVNNSGEVVGYSWIGGATYATE
ncbi:MAG TPA: hypothetical protein VEH77_17255, partial [Roseiarcus sp.]|nr:hypothetical protein [Roseiarcus sp.]